LLHIERHGAHLPVPRVLPALSGEVEPKVLVSEQTLTLRTVSYLDGISQNLGKPSVALMRELGTSWPKSTWPSMTSSTLPLIAICSGMSATRNESGRIWITWTSINCHWFAPCWTATKRR
jgi:hypothetical protein